MPTNLPSPLLNSSKGRRVLAASFMVMAVAILCILLPTASAGAVGSPVDSASLSTTIHTGSAGYTGQVSSGVISQLTMDSVVPSVVCQPSLPEPQYVGIDTSLVGKLPNGVSVTVGMNMNTICDKGSSTPRYAPLAYDCLGGNCTTLVVFSFPLSPGNRLAYSIGIGTQPDDSNSATMTMTDLSTGGTGTEPAHFNGTLSMTSAYWIVEGPSYPCTKSKCVQALTKLTSKIVFEDCAVVDSGTTIPVSSLSDIIESTMVDSHARTLAKASKLSSGGTHFTVKWVHST
jgi:hypothetical protein